MFNLFKRGIDSKKALNIGIERKYRYIYAAGGRLNNKGNIILKCRDLIYNIKAKDKEELAKLANPYDPAVDLLIFDDKDIIGVKDIIAYL